jgi:hypothetical protein
MAYLIFLKDSEGAENTLYRIAENQSDLNNLNINANSVKIIEDSQDNFNAIKYKTKHAFKYNNNIITYVDSENLFENKEQLSAHIKDIQAQINLFVKNNPNNPLVNTVNNYSNELNSLNLESITYPLNISLEQYLNNQGKNSLNPLQIP